MQREGCACYPLPMQHFTQLSLAAALTSALLSAQAPPQKTFLKVGDAAPDFAFKSTSTGQPFKLSDFKGKKTVVVAFFPAAFTGG